MAKRVHNPVLPALDKGVGFLWCRRRDNIYVSDELVAKAIEREVINIVAKGVLDLLANESKTKDDICSKVEKGV